jgi:hypothetical protein
MQATRDAGNMLAGKRSAGACNEAEFNDALVETLSELLGLECCKRNVRGTPLATKAGYTQVDVVGGDPPFLIGELKWLPSTGTNRQEELVWDFVKVVCLATMPSVAQRLLRRRGPASDFSAAESFGGLLRSKS